MITSIPQIVILIFSVVFHEVAHGRAALWKGDTTARDAGRLTMNPISHIDIFGTILFPLFLILTKSGVLFGWAKPVPISPWKFKDPKKDTALVSFAGPASNFFLAMIAGIAFRVFSKSMPSSHAVVQTLFFAVLINVILFVFNLLPIPPLDGSKIVMGFLPQEAAERYMQIGRFGFIIIFGLFFLGILQRILFPIVNIFLILIIGVSPFQ